MAKRLRAPRQHNDDTNKMQVEYRAVEALYTNKCTPENVARHFPGVSSVTVRKKCEAIPKGLRDTKTSYELSRKIHEIVGLPHKAMYTETEMREALFSFVRAELSLTKTAIKKKFGISKQTLQRQRARYDVAALEANLNIDSTDEQRHQVVSNMSFPNSGPQPYMDNTLVSTIFASNALSSDQGQGVTKEETCEEARQMCKAISEDAPTPELRDRLEHAVCGPHWFATNQKKVQEVYPALGAIKASQYSVMRAAAADPALTDAMFDKFEKYFDDLYDRGLMTTPRPQRHQMYCYDEFGLDPDGKYVKVICFRKPGQRHFQYTSGEKSPFLVTVGLTVRGDGVNNVPPIVVHQSSQKTALHVDKLPGNWLTDTSESGYITQPQYEDYLDNFEETVSHSSTDPVFLFADAYIAHMTPKIAPLVENGIHCMFGQSKDSANGQVGDCGPNGCTKSFVNKAIKHEMAIRPGCKITVPLANEALAKGYQDFLFNGGHSIETGFRVTGLFPWDRNAENHKRKRDLGDHFMTTERGEEKRQQLYKEGEYLQETNVEVTTQAMPATTSFTTVTFKGPDSMSQLTYLSSAFQALTKSKTVPAQQIHDEIQKNKENRRRKLPAEGGCSAPSTRTGAVPNHEFLHSLQLREHNLAAKHERSNQAAAKKQQTARMLVVSHAESFVELKTKLASLPSPLARDTHLRSLPADTLRGIVSHLTGTKSTETKPQLLERLLSVLPQEVIQLLEGAAEEARSTAQVGHVAIFLIS